MAAPPPRRRMGTSVKDLNGIGGGRPPAPAPSSGEAAMSASESARSLVQGQAEKFKSGSKLSVQEARELGIGFLYEDAKGMVKEDEEKPEDLIPDLPENREAREFLKNAPSKGLWMPLGKQVKVMQCWRCKGYGHRTGDRECPMNMTGNLISDAERQAREDPMSSFVGKKVLMSEAKEERRRQLQTMIEDIRREREEKKRRKKERKKEKRRRKEKKKEGKRKERRVRKDSRSSDDSEDSNISSSSSSSSSSDSSSESESEDEEQRRRKKRRQAEVEGRDGRNMNRKEEAGGRRLDRGKE